MKTLATTLAVLLLVCSSLAAQEQVRFPILRGEPDVIVDQRKPGYAALMKKVTPAVVSVFPAQLIAAGAVANPLDRFFGPGGDDDDDDDDGGAPQERIQGVGSGVILSSDGWILTNSHVVHLSSGALADAVKVELSDRRRFSAKIIGSDSLTDVALLKIDATDLPFLPVGDSDKVAIGDLVFAVGNPFQVGMTATMGMVSATRRSSLKLNGPGGYHSFIQTDAAINPGNSGGALVDVYGRLIGINTAIYSKDRGNIGIGFAIPSRLARSVAIALADDGKMIRGFFGIRVEDVDAEIAKQKKLPSIGGALIGAVMAGGPAEKARLQGGDVVLLANMSPIKTREDFRLAMSFVKPGGELQIDYFRDGKTSTTLMIAVADPARDEDGKSEEFGIEMLPGVTFRFDDEVLTVSEIEEKSVFRKTLGVDMVIIAINDKEIKTLADAADALRKGVNKVKVRKDNGESTLALRIE